MPQLKVSNDVVGNLTKMIRSSPHVGDKLHIRVEQNNLCLRVFEREWIGEFCEDLVVYADFAARARTVDDVINYLLNRVSPNEVGKKYGKQTLHALSFERAQEFKCIDEFNEEADLKELDEFAKTNGYYCDRILLKVIEKLTGESLEPAKD